MTAVASRPRHPWALAIGVVLLVPQLVLAVVVVREPLVVGLISFLMTLGWIRLAALGYRVLRERRPPVHRGALAVAGLVALLLGSWLFLSTTEAARLAADPGFRGAIAPSPAIGLNLLVILSSGLYLGGLVLLIGSAVGAYRARMQR